MSGILTSESVTGNGAFFGVYPENPRAFDYGPCIWDIRQNERLSILYNIPNIKSDNFAAKLEHGWWIGNIVAVQTGYPFNPIMSTSRSNEQVYSPTGGIDRPSVVTSANLTTALALNPNAVVYNPSTVITGNPNQWFNPNMFTLQPLGYLGTVSRDDLEGPHFGSWDLSINKDTALRALGESGKVQFRCEIFNLLNHANFAIPSVGVLSGSPATSGPTAGEALPLGTAGVISTTVSSPRQIQFALKLIF
jgi:hypothetical protein